MSSPISYSNSSDLIVKEKYDLLDSKFNTIPDTEKELNNLLVELLTSLPEGLKLEYLNNKEVNNQESMLKNARKQIEKLNKVYHKDPNWIFTNQEWNDFCRENLDNPRTDNEKRSTIVHKDNIKAIYNNSSDDQEKTVVIFDKRNFENNIVQVAQEVHLDNTTDPRREDLVIFVNGLPLVLIELKSQSGHSLREEAYPQACSYTRPKAVDSFNTLFRYLQLLVISNGSYSRYFANSISSKPDFYYGYTNKWTDAENRPLDNIFEFAQAFLNKKTILAVLFKYTVLTGLGKSKEEQNLKVLRPYQIAAAERILKQIKTNYNKETFTINQNNKHYIPEVGGYIWHTTGSGKTLTSFITTKLIAELEEYNIDKVLFVLDRKDLDAQTQREFSKIDDTSIGTRNIAHLKEALLKEKGKKVIITTIQKLNQVLDDDEIKQSNKNKRVVLIFDECHRSQFGDIQKKISTGRLFEKIYQFGFTGTPIFLENSEPGFFEKFTKAHQEDPNLTYETFNKQFATAHPEALKNTTQGIFGECLHHYVIKNAINDGNVLGFKIKYIKWKKGKIKDTSILKPSFNTNVEEKEALLLSSSNYDAQKDRLAKEIIGSNFENQEHSFQKIKGVHSQTATSSNTDDYHDEFMNKVNLGFEIPELKKNSLDNSLFSQPSSPKQAFAIKKSKPLFGQKTPKKLVSLETELENHRSSEPLGMKKATSIDKVLQYNLSSETEEEELLNSKDPNRIKGIATYILNNFQDHCGKRYYTPKFNALLAVEDIESAILYYNAFKELQQNKSNKLRITTIFSTTHQDNFKDFEEESGNTKENAKLLEGVIEDYSPDTEIDKKLFPNIVGEDIKKCEVDLVIVVGMLLTGFDAPCLKTIYIDKDLNYHGLVQAFSRTNRISEHKDVGLIVCFRDLEERIERSLKLFSNNADIEDFVTVENSFDDYFFGKEGYTDCYISCYNKFIDLYQNYTEELQTGQWSSYEDIKKQAIHLFNKAIKFIYKLRIYEQFEQLKRLEKEFASYNFDYSNEENYKNNFLLEAIKDQYQQQGFSFINPDYLDLILQKFLRAKYELPLGSTIDIRDFHDDNCSSLPNLLKEIQDQKPKDKPVADEIIEQPLEELDFYESATLNIDIEYLDKLEKKDRDAIIKSLEDPNANNPQDPKTSMIVDANNQEGDNFAENLKRVAKTEINKGKEVFKSKLEDQGYYYEDGVYELFLQGTLETSKLKHKNDNFNSSPFFNLTSDSSINKADFLNELKLEFKKYLDYAKALNEISREN